MHNIHFIYLLLLACAGLSSSAQKQPSSIRFQNMTVNDGLSMGTVTAFAQDCYGYMWIATAEGLHRYDGKRFKVFKHKEGDSNSLADSYVTSLVSSGTKLYVGTHLGMLDVMDVETYTFSHVYLNKQDKSYDHAIKQLLIYNNKLLINTDGGGLWEYVHSQRRVRKINLTKLNNVDIKEMAVVHSELYILTANALLTTNLNECTVVYQTQRNLTFETVCTFKEGMLIGSRSGLYYWQRDSALRELKLPPQKRYVKQINKLKRSNDKVWVASDGGLMQVEPDETVRLYRANQLRPFYLINDKVNDLFLDRENIVWVGTIGGVSKYAPQLSKFNLLQYFDYNDVNYGNIVYFTYEDSEGYIWLGTLTSGLVRLGADNTIDKVFPELGMSDYTTRSVRSVLQDSKGDFWVGTSLEGLFRFDPKTGKNKRIASTDQGNLKNNTIRSIFEDKDETIWLGTAAGLSRKDSVSSRFTHFQADSKHKNNSIYQVIQHPQNDLLYLASFRGGLQIFDKKTSNFEILKHNPRDSTSISNDNLMSLAWVNDDTLLIGTYGGGLNIFDLKTKKFSHVTEVDGLKNNVVYGVLYAGKGSVWLSTNDGLVNYQMYTKTFVNFKPVHYLQSTEFNEGAFLKSSKGVFYFGGVNGLNYFYPEKMKFDTIARKIRLTDIRAAVTESSENSITLDFLKSRLEIDFVCLYYANPEGVRYRYKLGGLDNDWVQVNTNTAVYSRLEPGKYSFVVEAKDEFGNWAVLSTPLSIRVKPPFWQRWWFILCVILMLTGIVFAVFRYRTREIERSYKLQLIDSELAALRSQMNPHFIFNSLNSIQYFILKKEPREAYSYLSKFAILMRKILQNSRLKYISVLDEIGGLDLYLELEKMRMDGNLQYQITTVNIEDETSVYMPTMLLQPYIENSILHGLLPKGENRKLDVTIDLQSSHLLCTITDNGIGREASREMNARRSNMHKSTGMSLTEQRLKILSEGKGKFGVNITDIMNDNGSRGTEVKLVIPIVVMDKKTSIIS